jgi:hypothetical protein
MFSWICPQCGRDVPPSKTDCPYCAEAAAEAAAAAAANPAAAATMAPPAWQPPPPASAPPQSYAPPPPPPPPAQYAPPQQAYAPPPPPQYAQPYPPPPHAGGWQQPVERKSGIPPWLVTVGFTVGFLALGAAFYFGVQHSGRTNPAEKAGVENPSNPSRQKVSNPLQKYVEVVGLRMLTEDKKPVAKFIVVNHSGTEIADLRANVTLWASTSRSEEDSVGTFSFTLPSLEPNESKELTEPLKTKLKMYELPDWQNATAEIQITSP